MATDPIKDWLQKTNKTWIHVNMLGAYGFIAASLFLLSITYLILFALAGWIPFLPSSLRYVVAGIGVIGCFIGNSIFGTAPVKPEQNIPGVKAAPPQNNDSVQTFMRMTMLLIFCGPKAMNAGMALLEKVKRLKKMDYDGCTLVLLILLSRDSRIPYTEIKQRIPRLDTLTVFGQLEDIEGILFLDSDPPGLTLSEALRREISIFRR